MPDQWSPGPWRNDDFEIHDANGNVVADCWGTEADAELIAAARELCEILDEVRDTVRSGTLSRAMLNKIDCALAKARPETADRASRTGQS
jgi:hypothetical protein